MKTLAVIGSHGMVGSDLVSFLKNKFDKITEIDRDNYDLHKGNEFDVVINANGNSNKVWANENRLGDFKASTLSVYKSLVDFPSKLYIYLSSFDVYEKHDGENENEIIEIKKLTPYGLHKFLSEQIIKNFTSNYIILRCPMMLGSKLRKGPIFDILNDSKLYISKDSSFQMITTTELAEIIFTLIEKNVRGEIFNVGGSGTIEFKDLGNFLGKNINFPKNGKTHKYLTDISKLNGIFPLKTSEEYLKEFIKKDILKP